jgi:hypothetical protein
MIWRRRARFAYPTLRKKREGFGTRLGDWEKSKNGFVVGRKSYTDTSPC